MMTHLHRAVRQAHGRLKDMRARAYLGERSRLVIEEKLTYLGPEKLGRLERAADATLALGPEGDALEFGVALGGSAIVLAHIARAHERSFHGFDVFGMIPAPTSQKDDEKSRKRFQVIAAGNSEGIGGDLYYGYRPDLYSDVCDAFSRHGLAIDGTQVALHKGLFEDTWRTYRSGRVAFVHIDCDWYDPVKFCLERVADRMDTGSRIVLDDYHDYGGCREATDEFLAARPEFQLQDGPNVILLKTSSPN
jgi:asparagine synthase (glutamine-hydrolysing)